MRTLKLMFSAILVMGMTQMNAQIASTGKLNSTTMSTFNYMVDGVKMPYTVKVEENRAYGKSLEEKTKQMTGKKGSLPALVSKVITITNEASAEDNKVISLAYPKQITDSFELVSTDKGFAVIVDDKKMEYIMGTGIYFANTADKDFFIVDKYDVEK